MYIKYSICMNIEFIYKYYYGQSLPQIQCDIYYNITISILFFGDVFFGLDHKVVPFDLPLVRRSTIFA